MPGGGKPIDLATLTVPQLFIRAAAGTLIATAILAGNAVNLYKGGGTACKDHGNTLFSWLFFGSSGFAIVFCLAFLAGWNLPIFREWQKRRVTAQPPPAKDSRPPRPTRCAADHQENSNRP
jgi:hypothetical protein